MLTQRTHAPLPGAVRNRQYPPQKPLKTMGTRTFPVHNKWPSRISLAAVLAWGAPESATAAPETFKQQWKPYLFLHTANDHHSFTRPVACPKRDADWSVENVGLYHISTDMPLLQNGSEPVHIRVCPPPLIDLIGFQSGLNGS